MTFVPRPLDTKAQDKVASHLEHARQLEGKYAE